MALNPPPLKLYDCANLALNDIYKFVKRQGYAVLTFRLKTNKQLLPTVRKMWLWCWKTSPQQYHVMRLGRTSWQESDQLENFDRWLKFLEISSTTYIEISNA